MNESEKKNYYKVFEILSKIKLYTSEIFAEFA